MSGGEKSTLSISCRPGAAQSNVRSEAERREGTMGREEDGGKSKETKSR
jgi:hypothetical protein